MTYDLVEINWDTTLVTKLHLEDVTKYAIELHEHTTVTSKGCFLSVKPHGKFRVSETACEFTPENDRCPIRLGEKL